MTYFASDFTNTSRLALLAVLTIVVGCSGQARPSESLVIDSIAEPLTPVRAAAPGLEAMATLERLPLLYPPGTQTRQFSSYDTSGGNWDGDFVRSFTKYVQRVGTVDEYVFFDEYGPGCLYREQMNVWTNGLIPGSGAARIKFYFDDEATPRINKTLDEFFGGSDSTNALTYKDPMRNPDGSPATRFAIQYSPLPFAKRLKIALVPANLSEWSGAVWKWHQNTHLIYPQDQPVASWAPNTTQQAIVANEWAAVGSDPKPASKIAAPQPTMVTLRPNTPTTIFADSAPGAIQRLAFTVNPASMWTAMFATTIQAYWDGEATPSVSMPLGYFFGAGRLDGDDGRTVATRTLKNLMYGFNGSNGTFYAYWPMPYGSSARIVLTNTSSSPLNIVHQVAPSSTSYPAGTVGYFRAKRTQDAAVSTTTKAYASTFHETGRGHVVGISFYSRNFAMDGDEFTFLDGSRTPQIHGDGTEDDHNQGWGGDAHQAPLWGALLNGYNGAYRLYLNDAYVFFDDVKINYEYSFDGDSEPPATHQTDVVVFYYRAAGDGILKLSDRLDVGDSASEESHEYSKDSNAKPVQLRSSFSGYEWDRNNGRFTDTGYEVTSSHFKVAIDPQNRGVRLRKLINRAGNGVQVASVRINGVALPRPWSIVNSSSVPNSQGWMESDYDIPAARTSGKSSLVVDIALTNATACVLNEFLYVVYSFM